MTTNRPGALHDIDQLNQTAAQIGEFLNHPYTVFISGKVADEVLTGFSYQIAHKESAKKNNPFVPAVQSRMRDLILASVASTSLKSCELMIESEDNRRYACTIPDISQAIEERFVSGTNDLANVESNDLASVDTHASSLPEIFSIQPDNTMEVTIHSVTDGIHLSQALFGPHLSIIDTLRTAYPKSLFGITVSISASIDPQSVCTILNLQPNEHAQAVLPTREDLEKTVVFAAANENIDNIFVRVFNADDQHSIELPKIDSAHDALCMELLFEKVSPTSH